MKKNIITFGEIMLRLSTPEYQRFSQAKHFDASFGGGESNVAVSLANFGLPVQFITRIPDNDIGESALMELKKYGVGTDNILKGGERLGIYFIEKGAVSRASKVVYDRAYSSISQIEIGMVDWEKIFEKASWFHWTGITPAISQNAADVCLEAIEVANKMGITVSTDLNYRKNLWNYGKTAQEVMPLLVAGCNIVLGNEEDAEKSLGIKPKNVNVESGKVEALAYEEVSKEIMKRYPRVEKVITTLRTSISASHNKWAGVLFDGKTLYKSEEYNISHIVDRVGAGDSFMAGLIYGLNTFKENNDALSFATAASCLKHTIHGDFNLVTVEEVEKLMGGDSSGRVSR